MASVWQRYREIGLVIPDHGGGRVLVLKLDHLNFIDEQLLANTELSAAELQQKLESEFGLHLSRPTVP